MSKKSQKILALLSIALILLIAKIDGHGMLLEPAGRSSRWRIDRSAPINYDDNGLFCGGFGTQWNNNGGKCGMCGDDYADPTPRANELDGTYGQGVITRRYTGVYTAHLGIMITANHFGYFYFNICNLDESVKETEECFAKHVLKLVDGSDKLYINNSKGWVNTTVVLPEGMNCKHCVLRWNYRAGNNWGICKNGRGALGCGPQENFKSCADISIRAPDSIDITFDGGTIDTYEDSLLDKIPDVGDVLVYYQ